MNRTPSDWSRAIAALKPGLTIAQASRQLNIGYAYTQKLCKGRYNFTRQPRTTDHSQDKLNGRVNWKLTNIEIARKYGVSQEWVRRKRMEAGKEKVRGRKV